MYNQVQYDHRMMYNQLNQAVMQHKTYIDQIIDNVNTYGGSMTPDQLNGVVSQITNQNGQLQALIPNVEQITRIANSCGDNDVMFRANSLRGTILGMNSTSNNFIGHIYNLIAQRTNNAMLPQQMLQNGYPVQMVNNNVAMNQQAFLPQYNTTYTTFGQQEEPRDHLMINSRTNPAGWNATNMATDGSLDVYGTDGNKQETKVTVNKNFNQPEGFKNEFNHMGNTDLDLLLSQYGVQQEVNNVQLPDKNNNDILTVVTVDDKEIVEAKNKEINQLKAEIEKLKQELKMENRVKGEVVDISFNEFLLDQDNKSMSASYRSNGLKIMVQVGELPKPVIRDIETCDYSVTDKAADMTTLTFNNLIESSLRRTMLAEQLQGEAEADKILICSDFMSSIVSLVSDRTYVDLSDMQKLAKEFVSKFKHFQTSLENCFTLPQIYDAIESLNNTEFGKEATEYLKVVLKDELNDFFRYSIETVAGNLVKGELDKETVEVIHNASTSPAKVGGWLDTPSARKVYKGFLNNLRDMFQNFFDIIDIGDDDLPSTDSNTIPVHSTSRTTDEKSVTVFLKVKTRTFGIRFDETLDKLTNGKQVQGVVTMESNPELHNILDHCVTDPENKRSTNCKLDYVPGNNHLMICGNPGINVCYRIYPRYDVKGDGVIRRGFFIKMMSSY